MKKRRLALFLGFSISLGFLFLAFYGLDWANFFRSLRALDPAPLLPAMALELLILVIYAQRERILLASVADVPMRELTRVHAITAMGNNVYPMSGGEALRVFLLKRKFNVPIPTSTGNVLVARIVDGLVLMGTVLLVVALIDVPSAAFVTLTTLAAPLFLLLTLGVIGLTAYPDLTRRLVALLVRWLPDRFQVTLIHAGEQVVESLSIIRDPRGIVGVIGTTMLARMVEALLFWLVLIAFDIPLGLPAAMLTVAVVNLAGVVSASPGQIGVNQFATGLVLTALAISQDTAMAYAIVLHMVEFLPVTLVGFWLLTLEGLSLRTVADARTTQEIDMRHTMEIVARHTQEINPYVG